MPGRLTLCATPIGNLGDVSERLRNTLLSADVIYAEDTRRTAKLAGHLGVRVPMVSLFSGNETSRTERVVESVMNGDTVVIVSDAGMPTVSDPGAAAVRAVRAAGYPVSVVPGPSAVTTAIALSGFGGDRFVFEGFLPRRGEERKARLAGLAAEERAIVVFASPKRLTKDLADLAAMCGGAREIAVTRELTKLHEETWVGTLADSLAHFTEPVKGEVTLVLGPLEAESPSVDDAVAAARDAIAGGASVREAARAAAEGSGVSRREIYEVLIRDQT